MMYPFSDKSTRRLWTRHGCARMDESTLEKIAHFICGNGDDCPQYRTSSQLTSFFARAGLPRFVHDGSTRAWWVLDCLKQCSREELAAILKRLVSPKEYSGDKTKVAQALKGLNEAVYIEGFKLRLDGVEPRFEKVDVTFDVDVPADGVALKPLPAPNFFSLDLEPGIGAILQARWAEAQQCLDAKAYLASIIMMGSLLEGLLLAVCQRNPRLANSCSAAPKDSQSGKIKRFHEWSLAEMIDVAHSVGWLDLDVKRFSHELRIFRNLVHPYEQMATRTNPDADTCRISWLVVQAAANDLTRAIQLTTS